jgi:hypothetical protein
LVVVVVVGGVTPSLLSPDVPVLPLPPEPDVLSPPSDEDEPPVVPEASTGASSSFWTNGSFDENSVRSGS